MQHYANLERKKILVKMIGWLHNVLYVNLADNARFNLTQMQSGSPSSLFCERAELRERMSKLKTYQ